MNTIKDKNKDNIPSVFNTAKIEEIIEREKLSLPLKRTERLWFNKKTGVRREGIKFAMTRFELDEYIRCKLSVYYFAEHYCQIKREDGTIGPMKLRDYQKDIIDLYTKNPRSILMASRQTGKCMTFVTNVTILSGNGQTKKIPIGLLYYDEIKKERNLTLSEKIKIFLYKILYKIQ